MKQKNEKTKKPKKISKKNKKMESIKYISETTTENLLDNDYIIIEISYTPPSLHNDKLLKPFVGRFLIPKGYKLSTTFGRKNNNCTTDYSEILPKQFSRKLLTLTYNPKQSESVHVEVHGTNKYTNNFYKNSTYTIGNLVIGTLKIKHL